MKLSLFFPCVVVTLSAWVITLTQAQDVREVEDAFVKQWVSH